MKPIGALLFITLSVLVLVLQVGAQQFKKCEMSAYPPQKHDLVPVYEVDLDHPPSKRWDNLMKDRGPQVTALVDAVSDLAQSILGTRLYELLLSFLPKVAESMPSPYYEELQGISAASGVPIGKMTLYNIFYEAFSVCTSIVAQDPAGHLIHARNLDNGAFLGWDSSNHTWRIAELLHPLSVHLVWKKDNATLFRSINFAGYIGVLTGVKENKFSFSLNKRLSLGGGLMGILEWVLFGDHKQSWVSLLPREVLEEADNYKEAQHILTSRRLLAPVYYILAGPEPLQGCIITRDRDNSNLVTLGSKTEGSGSWFLVQTNYDNWKQAPFFDDRRTPSCHCLTQAGQQNTSSSLLYNVLSTKPVLNKETVYTAVMDPKSGELEAWLRTCPDPCWPW
ncbi:hypothetical protein Pmani_037136 [Petrolisthes manimaculis]|uniref:Acid ceramidase n=1 Tax=Petrolisthes manimaculis TaxID=1843537 RepID=A0AAE1TLS5_9EUCA|nr:hypothetical protein Pmani_037136 [Petrolisthes manimaculis]